MQAALNREEDDKVKDCAKEVESRDLLWVSDVHSRVQHSVTGHDEEIKDAYTDDSVCAQVIANTVGRQ